ncbi:heparinase II/III family protein [Flavobacterium sp. FlaQc-30]|uniref:heparinase II/III domain-containing protein n=1 Tax=Flavobacterium sp. FlaQc-30 TaxID=3374179 RepID=UPI003756A337
MTYFLTSFKTSVSNYKSSFGCVVLGIFLLFSIVSNAQKKRDLLSAFLQQNILETQDGSYNIPFDKKELHDKIKNLPQDVQEKILSEAYEAMKYNWPSIPVTSYLDFKRNGDRMRMEQYWSDGLDVLKKLVLAEVLEGQGKFIDAIINGSWAVCEQSTWVLSAHLPSQKGGAGIPNINDPIIDLGAGEMASTLAWTYYFFKDDFEKVSPFLKARIPYEITHRIIEPYITRDDFWWMSFKNENFVNNWNPWCNYNVLLSTLLLGEEITPKARKQVIEKSMKSVDKFINYYKDDGACEEGPAYWSHAAAKMMEYLELLKTYSGGKISLSDFPIIKNMGKYILNAHIYDDYYINFADSSVRLQTSPGIVFRYGTYVNDTSLKQFGSFLAKKEDFYLNPTKGSLDIALHNIDIYPLLKDTPSVESIEMSFWYNGTEIAGGRTDKSASKGFFFAAKGGYNDESHNHNDVGTFILYHDGKPLFVDIGVETYSKKTFGPERYKIWTMQSDYHNLPMINGFAQVDGKKFKASEVHFLNSKSQLRFSLNLAGAYPEAASCKSWNRTYTLKRASKSVLIIEDQFELKEYKGESIQHFIVAQLPVLEKEGKIKLKDKEGRSVSFYYPEDLFSVKIEELILTDKRLLSSWKQDRLYRIVMTDKKKLSANKYKFQIVEN